eukprot:scaffold76436_cov75-Phaeocystis_antarctica.AAC.1
MVTHRLAFGLGLAPFGSHHARCASDVWPLVSWASAWGPLRLKWAPQTPAKVAHRPSWPTKTAKLHGVWGVTRPVSRDRRPCCKRCPRSAGAGRTKVA